jgi:hypothetical protein
MLSADLISTILFPSLLASHTAEKGADGNDMVVFSFWQELFRANHLLNFIP